MVCEISSLSHETSDYSVEGATLVMKRPASLLGYTLFSCTKSTEILRSLWSVIIQLNDNPSFGFATDRDIKEDSRMFSRSTFDGLLGDWLHLGSRL